MHDVTLLALGIPKVLEVEGTDSKIGGPLNLTHTYQEGEQEEERGPHGTELQETVTLCAKTKTQEGD